MSGKILSLLLILFSLNAYSQWKPRYSLRPLTVEHATVDRSVSLIHAIAFMDQNYKAFHLLFNAEYAFVPNFAIDFMLPFGVVFPDEGHSNSELGNIALGFRFSTQKVDSPRGYKSRFDMRTYFGAVLWLYAPTAQVNNSLTRFITHAILSNIHLQYPGFHFPESFTFQPNLMLGLSSYYIKATISLGGSVFIPAEDTDRRDTEATLQYGASMGFTPFEMFGFFIEFTGLSTLTAKDNDSLFFITPAIRGQTEFVGCGIFVSIPLDENLRSAYDAIIGIDLRATF